jgi:hypothetical protein
MEATQVRKIFWFLLLPFVLATVVWFIVVAASNGTVDAGQAFVGLGYAAGVVLIVLLVLVGAQYLNRGLGSPPPPASGDDEWAERKIIKAQLWVGAFLIAFGATLAVVFGVVLDDTDKVALAIGTAVIGAGAALMPPGAAAGAGQRLTNGNGSPPPTPQPPITAKPK